MLVSQIEMSQVRFFAETECDAADMRLHLLDAEGHLCGHVLLTCSVHHVLDESRDGLTERLVNEARRQMSWMPEYRMGESSLTFAAGEPQLLVA